jgi:acetyl esterase/lipase
VSGVLVGCVLTVLPLVAACTNGGSPSRSGTAGPSSSTGGGTATNPPVATTDPVGMRTDSNLTYAPVSPSQRLDLIRPAASAASAPPAAGGTFPVVVVIHGGAFSVGDKTDMRNEVRALVARGYAVASPNYRMSGEAPFPAAVADVKAAVRWLRANADRYGLDPTRIGAIGESAGANLAAMLGTSGNLTFPEDTALGNITQPSTVRAVVDLFGPITFTTMDDQLRSNPHCTAGDVVHDRPDSPESRYLGHTITTVPDLVRQASPLGYLDDGRIPPPFLIEHGDADCTVPFGQSQELAAGLRAAGGSVQLTIIPGAGHGGDFPLIARLPGILTFLDQTLR